MRKIFIFLSCLITMPAAAFDDACTRPKAFTVDKRCYVTDEQKKQKPFDATVSVAPPWASHPHCTGTLVKGYKDDKDTIYVYTAKHCVIDDKDSSLQTISIALQDGTRYTANPSVAGSYKSNPERNLTGDYALYTIQDAPKDIPYTKLSDKWGFGGLRYISARAVGYGRLKIMSDEEIKDFKDKYIDFLHKNGQNTNVGIRSGGVDTASTYGIDFLSDLWKNEYTYYDSLFNNTLLKVSECKYLSTGGTYHCQGWGGDSGGGIFDDNGKLMGIKTRGNRIIGGDEHADNDGFLDSIIFRNSSIPIAF